MPQIKTRKKQWTKHIPINIQRFIQELETEPYTPLRYFIELENK